ncbi:MAG: NADPH-dependent FMN reductase [Actinomycetota bacterium]
MTATPHIVGIGGTTRDGSSTEKALRYALAMCEKAGATTAIFTGKDLAGLPMYAPELPDRTDVARALIEELRRSHGVIVASPGYHGTIAGIVKNALDYTEDLREDDRVYFSGMPVGCIVTGLGWQGVVTTLEHLRAMVHALRGWPTPLGAALNTSTPLFGADGQPSDERARFQLEMVAEEVMQFVGWKLALPE